MSKYLDLTGLSYLVSKVSSKFVAKTSQSFEKVAASSGTGHRTVGNPYTPGTNAVQIGLSSKATGSRAVAEGSGTASGDSSHAEGSATTASQMGAHAEGIMTTASQAGAHAEGITSIASGVNSHAEGGSHATGNISHAEGESTASGSVAHAEGTDTIASGAYSHASGYATTAANTCEFACGTYNNQVTSSDTSLATAFTVGIGTSDTAKADAIDVRQNGDCYIYGKTVRLQDWIQVVSSMPATPVAGVLYLVTT